MKADLRAYEHPVMLGGEMAWDRLLEAVGMILKQVPGLNRCLWNLGPRMPVAARPVTASMTRDAAGPAARGGCHRHGRPAAARLYDGIWQCPTVLVPLELDGAGRELVIVRPIHSERAMTATPASLPAPLVEDLRRAILAPAGRRRPGPRRHLEAAGHD